MIHNSLCYSVKLDSDLFSYHVKPLWKPLFSLLGFSTYIELPCNTILRAEPRLQIVASTCTIYICSHNVYNNKLRIKRLRTIYGLSKTICDKILERSKINRKNNLSGENPGLTEIQKRELVGFYNKTQG